MAYTINQLARLAGVSVRTLHHYHALGLLQPAEVAANGYRLYGREELLKLQQILFFKELKFPLAKIREILESPQFDRVEALKQQKKLLELERERMGRLIQTITTTINETTMKDDELFEGFDEAKLEEYRQEAEQRWGHTQAYKQSQERWNKLSKEERAQLFKDQDAGMKAMADDMKFGPESPEFQKHIDASFKFINEKFYDCSLEMFRNLAVMTTEDERYAGFYRKYHPELPEFRLKAVQFYCDQHSQ